MRYAGFWPRLGAALIDFLVFMPFTLAYAWWPALTTREALMWYQIPITLLFALYPIYFIGRWGQTLGKMALGIRVVTIDGASTTMWHGFLRHSVDLLFSLLSSLAIVMALVAVSSTDFDVKPVRERFAFLSDTKSIWEWWIDILWQVWIWSELVVLLLNKKRRALHDFVAGTVVVHVQRQTSAV